MDKPDNMVYARAISWEEIIEESNELAKERYGDEMPTPQYAIIPNK